MHRYIKSPKKILMAYLADGGDWDGNKLAIDKVTHISYAFARINEGRVVGDHLRKVHWIKELKQRNPSLKMLLSIGGWSAEGFSDAALTEESRTLFADTAVGLMYKLGFDGLDLDWEYPCRDWAGIVARPEDKQNYTAMVKKLREKLDMLTNSSKNKYLLTMAAGGAKLFADDMELELITPCFDFISLMTYEFYNGDSKIAGHHTNLFPSKDDPTNSAQKVVHDFMESGVPADKLVLGSAFYSRGWSGMDSTMHPLLQPARPGISYAWSSMSQYIDNNGFKRYWDESARAPYVWNGEIFMSYDDPESLKSKALYVRFKNLAGIMFWEWSQDRDNELLNAIYNNLY